MDASYLIRKHKEHNPTSHYFDRETLRFFGERVSDMTVFKNTASVKDSSGNTHDVYILSSLQRNHPLGARRKYSYFDSTTFEEIIPR